MTLNPHQALLVMTFVKIGDFLILTPAIQAVQERYPQIVIAVPDDLFSLYKEQKIFSRYISMDKVEAYCKSNESQILNLSFPLIPGLQIPKEHLSLKDEYFKRPQHVFQSYVEALREYFPRLPLGLKAEPFLEFSPRESIFERWDARPFYYFTVHSGSDFFAKNWNPKNFEDLINRLLNQYPTLKCLSFVGPSDQPLFQDRPLPSRFHSVKGDLETVAQLLMASLFHVDSDSGIHHLAGAANTPSITVFGATGPGSWSSLTERNFIHWGGPECANPCFGSKLDSCEDRVCISSVKVEHLMSSANQILSAYNHLHIQ